MNDRKEIPLGPNESLIVFSDGTVIHQRDECQFYPRVFIEQQQRKFTNYQYKRFYLKGKRYYLHRILAICFVENPANFGFVNHIDGNSLNNTISNLEWCHNSSVIIDMSRRQEADKHYQTIDRDRLTGLSKGVYNYYMTGDETTIRQLFQTDRLRDICAWAVAADSSSRFDLLYDDLYENILAKIRRGVFLPGYDERGDHRFFNYCVNTCRWMATERQKLFAGITERPQYVDRMKRRAYDASTFC